MEILTWVALILAIAAVWSTRVTRSEQARLHAQLEKLRRQLADSGREPIGRGPASSAGQDKREVRGEASSVTRPGEDATPLSVEAETPEAEEQEQEQEQEQETLSSWLSQKKKRMRESGPEELPEPETAPIDRDAGIQSPADLISAGIVQAPQAETGRDDDLQEVFNEGDTAVDTAAPTRSLEERLGAGVYVWAGGIALMLAGAFLVKYSFDKELLSVGARLGIAGGAGVAMVLASLWVRSRADKVAASLCGAGVAVMYAAILSGTAHFDVLGPWVGFALMIAVTATAVGMSLLHGPFVALLGLIGGFVTPALINGTESAWGPTFTYLLLLEIGLAVVTRKRQWFGLSAMTLAMSILSAVVYALFAWDTDSRGWLILFVMGTAVVFVLNAARAAPVETDRRSGARVIWLGIGALGSSALLLSMLVAVSGFSSMELVSLGVLGAGAVLLGRLDRRYVTLAFLAEALCGMMLLAWPLAYEFTDAALEPRLYWQVTLGYGAVFALGGYVCLWRNNEPRAYAWLSAIGALGFAVLMHVGGGRFLGFDWWMIYGAAAVLLAGASASVWRERTLHGGWVVDAYALMAAAAATLSAWFGLDHPWIAVAWAGMALAVCALDRYLQRARLLYATGWLSVGSVLLLIVPGPTGYDMPMTLIANTMLLHYGIPAVCFAGIAWLYRRHRVPWVTDVSQALALIAGVVAVSLQVRLGFHRDALWASGAGLYEWATQVTWWLLVCWVVCWMMLRWCVTDALRGLNQAAAGVGMLGLIGSVLYLLLQANPVMMPVELGGWVGLNGLLYAYGLPCVLAAMVAKIASPETELFKQTGLLKQAAGAVSFALLYALVLLEVRHGFVGSNMLWSDSPAVVLNEWATYSVVMLVVSMGMFWAARWRGLAMLENPACVMGMSGLVVAVLGPIILCNPLFRAGDVGDLRVFNGLLYVYGLPMLLSVALAYWVPSRLWQIKPIAAGVSLLLLFALVSLQIRQGFVGADLVLKTHPVGSAENYSYSLGWVLLALTLLAGGLMTGRASLRYGSLAVMLVAMCKVALDTAQLRDLWRVLSLLGLGLSLIVLGYVYQRYVFRRSTDTEGVLKDKVVDHVSAPMDE